MTKEPNILFISEPTRGIDIGAKKMILVDDVDNRQFLCELVESMWEELPKKKELQQNRKLQG